MGNIHFRNLWCCYSTSKNVNIALKLPHGTSYLLYDHDSRKFLKSDDINNFIEHISSGTEWNNWIIYNDQIDSKDHSGNGHCKGFLLWNNKKIIWVCHSVPNFPSEFDGKNISKIQPSQLVYGQSFISIEIPYSISKLNMIVSQIKNMNAYVYNSTIVNDSNNKKEKKVSSTLLNIKIHKHIRHLSKPPQCHIDIYDYIQTSEKTSNSTLYVETWKRGHSCSSISDLDDQTNHKIIDIHKCKYNSDVWYENQDHSKWATTGNKHYFIGDLNRMTTQFKRGGGGFLCKDEHISKLLYDIISE